MTYFNANADPVSGGLGLVCAAFLGPFPKAFYAAGWKVWYPVWTSCGVR